MVQLCVLLWAAQLMFAPSAAAAGVTIHSVKADYSASSGTTVTVKSDTLFSAKIFELKGDAPRIVIDISDARLGINALRAQSENTFGGAGAVSQIRFAPRGRNGLRLVADLHPGGRLGPYTNQNGVISIFVKSPMQANVRTQSRGALSLDGVRFPRLAPHRLNRYVARGPAQTQSKTKPVIVIDAGHGGYDPGAVGVKGTKEETVTLSAALELRKILNATGRYTVVLTREKDEYVKHVERVRIARKAGADLFISLHADSGRKTETRGVSVYTLANRASRRSKKLVNEQNWVLDVDLTEQSDQVGNILVDLAQRKTRSRSADFAAILIPKLQPYAKMLANTHRRAGYYVLLAPDVPAILLEMGFLSNCHDEKLLSTRYHRRQLMRGVASAIDVYFMQQKRLHGQL